MCAVRLRHSWAGLLAVPPAWAVSTQLNYVLVPWECEHRVQIVPVVALGLAAWRCWAGRFPGAPAQGGAALKPERETGTRPSSRRSACWRPAFLPW